MRQKRINIGWVQEDLDEERALLESLKFFLNLILHKTQES